MKRIAIGLAALLLLTAFAAAQAKPATGVASGQKLILEFVDGLELTVTGPDKSVMKFGAGVFEGDQIAVGSTIVTGKTTSAELRLKPNGSIIKLAKATSFTVSALAATNQDKNAFQLVTGKVRAVAAKGAQYQVTSQTTVCAVRGTDFAFDVRDGSAAILAVAKGLVQFDRLGTGGSILGTVNVGAGMMADAFAATFQAVAFTAEQYAEQFGDVGFQRLLETEVPEQALDSEPVAAAAAPVEPGKEVSPAEAAEMLKPSKEEVESGLIKWLREALGMEIGSVTIAGTTYSKAVIQPNINLGKVKFGLYLPIIYTSDLFDPDNWYHPAGNDEWSFGKEEFAAGDYVGGGLDAAKDFALKIKYFEFGQPLQDPFFFKIGNLNDMTLGHGLIMRNYANDTEFPAVRRIGVNTGIDAKFGGFEALVNDLADPSIFGTRLFVRPLPIFALGVSGVVDIDPMQGLGATEVAKAGDPMMIGAGVDIDMPIIKSSLLGIRLFADAAAIVPYLQEAPTGGGDEGLRYDLVYKDGNFSNWGAAGGLMGNVLFIDWRLEFRYYTGLFRPSYFDSTYDKSRGALALEYTGYLASGFTADTTPTVMGVYGEGGFGIMKDKLSFRFGYMWPWSPDASLTEQLATAKDEFHAKLVVKKGLVPIFDVYGSIGYDRHGLVQSIMDGDFQLLDENTTFGGELVVPVPKTPNLDLAVIFKSVPARYTEGNAEGKEPGTIQYIDEAKGIPKLIPSVGIETRFHL